MRAFAPQSRADTKARRERVFIIAAAVLSQPYQTQLELAKAIGCGSEAFSAIAKGKLIGQCSRRKECQQRSARAVTVPCLAANPRCKRRSKFNSSLQEEQEEHGEEAERRETSSPAALCVAPRRPFVMNQPRFCIDELG